MPETRDVPGWAEKADSTDTRRLVVCGGCEVAMPWSTFVNGHLRKCGGSDPRDGNQEVARCPS